MAQQDQGPAPQVHPKRFEIFNDQIQVHGFGGHGREKRAACASLFQQDHLSSVPFPQPLGNWFQVVHIEAWSSAQKDDGNPRSRSAVVQDEPVPRNGTFSGSGHESKGRKKHQKGAPNTMSIHLKILLLG
jgi:hypothetical protein